MSALEELMHAALAAPPQRQEDALSVLRGQTRTVDPNEAPPINEPYLTLRETAKRLGLSAATLTRWRIPGHSLGGRRRFKVSEVEAYFKTEPFQRRVAALRAERNQERKGNHTP
jgi:excisionase family DNA binding protein